jgi:hemoglobin-like flavoprotein
MTPEQIQLVKTSWTQIVPISDQAAQLFYGRLFEVAPEVKPLFKGDMIEQGAKLMMMLNTAVNSLERLDQIVPAIQAMGRRHVDYGAKDEHYDYVGDALLWTLEQGLGDGFTDEVKAAWTDTYARLAETMKAAAAEQAA